jgi:hypothetical protein
MTTADKQALIVAALYMDFMQGGDAMSVAAIAEATDLTPTQVSHAAFNDKRIAQCRVKVPVRERNNRTVTHYRECTGFKLSRWHLRELLLEATQ